MSERWAKPLLPIDGRPVLATLLHALRGAGVEVVALVSGHLAHQVEALAGDGSAFGLDVRHVRQPDPLGSADAVRRGLAAVEPPVLVTAADTVYAGDDVARVVAAWTASGCAGAVTARRDPPPGPGKPPVLFVAGRVARVVHDDPSAGLASAPLWALDGRLAPYVERTAGPPFELAAAYQAAIDDGVPVAGIEIGATRDLTSPFDLARENFPYLAAF